MACTAPEWPVEQELRETRAIVGECVNRAVLSAQAVASRWPSGRKGDACDDVVIVSKAPSHFCCRQSRRRTSPFSPGRAAAHGEQRSMRGKMRARCASRAQDRSSAPRR